MGAMVIALGFAVLFQFIILRMKFNKGMYTDIGVDIAMLVLLNIVFGGSILGVVSATAGSTLISLYLMWKPVVLFENNIDIGSSDTKDKPREQSVTERFDSLFN